MDPMKNPIVYDPSTGLPAQAHPAQACNPNTGLQAHAVAVQMSQPVPPVPGTMGVEHLPAQQHVPVGGNGHVANGQMHAQPQVAVSVAQPQQAYYNGAIIQPCNNGRQYPCCGMNCPVHPALIIVGVVFVLILFGGISVTWS